MFLQSSFKLLIALSACLAVASAAQLRCEYRYESTGGKYECDGEITTLASDYFVDSVTGDHLDGKSNDEVDRIVLSDVSLEVMPRNLITWFRNYRELAMSGITNFPNFKRSDFSDLTHLTSFYARNLPLVKRIPRDTFWDLTRLTSLSLDGMTNLENLDADLLINTRSLVMFSVQGPNQVTEISPGFFRNQDGILRFVNFSGTNLRKIGYTVFENLNGLSLGRFTDSGCLNRDYETDVARMLTADIRNNCENFVIRRNTILKKKPVPASSSSTSSSSESQQMKF